MSLLTVQRSPTPAEYDSSQSKGYDTADSDVHITEQKINSECYFYVKGTAVILLQPDRSNIGQGSPGGEIELHLQSILRILRSTDSLTMAVRLQSSQESQSLSSKFSAKYLAVVVTYSHLFHSNWRKEVIVIGVDCLPDDKAIVGLVIPILPTMQIQLDGDGGIVIDYNSSLYLFRPISVQAMWTVFQCMHREILDAEKSKSPSQIVRSLTHGINYSNQTTDILNFYQKMIVMDDSLRLQWERSTVDCLMEKNHEIGLSSASDGRFGIKQNILDDTIEAQIYSQLKEIMQTVDLDEVTSKDIRLKVEENMKRKLDEYKDFMGRQMLVIMGQMDKASRIFSYLYLGTEWNACDWNWLHKNRIEYIVNVTNEVENFFPARLKYLKIRVTDEASSELLKHWNQTNQFIKEAKEKGGKILVHCKKGISRSSSTVIAFAMKEYGWGLSQAMEHVKRKRNCITPNKGFVEQLQTFEGMLRAFKKRHHFDKNLTECVCKNLSENYGKRHRCRSHQQNSNKKTGRMSRRSANFDETYENTSIVKNLVGSFEAKRQSTEESSKVVQRMDLSNRSPVALRFRKFADWSNRHSLAVSLPTNCNNSTPARQLRALTISQ